MCYSLPEGPVEDGGAFCFGTRATVGRQPWLLCYAETSARDEGQPRATPSGRAVSFQADVFVLRVPGPGIALGSLALEAPAVIFPAADRELQGDRPIGLELFSTPTTSATTAAGQALADWQMPLPPTSGPLPVVPAAGRSQPLAPRSAG
jgi:hypothetical protein